MMFIIVTNQRILLNTERVTTNNTSRTWSKVTFTLITPTNTQLCSLTSTTWRLCSKLLAQSKSHLTTRAYQEAEEVFCSYSSTSDQSTPFPDLEDGPTTNGSEVWFGIMNISSASTLDMLKSATSLTSLVPNSQFSTTFTPDMKPSNWQECGLISQRKSKLSIWSIPSNKSNMLDFKVNTITLRRELWSTIWQTKSLTLKLTSIKEQWTCWDKSRTTRTRTWETISRRSLSVHWMLSTELCKTQQEDLQSKKMHSKLP